MKTFFCALSQNTFFFPRKALNFLCITARLVNTRPIILYKKKVNSSRPDRVNYILQNQSQLDIFSQKKKKKSQLDISILIQQNKTKPRYPYFES